MLLLIFLFLAGKHKLLSVKSFILMKTLYTILFASFIFIFQNQNILAAPGDTTSIAVHQAVDMTWYGAYEQMGNFPDGSATYNKVLMIYTMGCASGGCSDWDYTTKIEARIPTGTYDSTVVSLDTISTMPLEVDTTWNVYEVIESFELGRVITPYGGYMATNQQGYNNNWTHDYIFDVTDFVHLLRDDVIIRAFYDGWSSGFAVSLDFKFIEGTPNREVIELQNVYQGSGGYQNTGVSFELNHLPQKTFTIPADASSAKLRVTISGHGFDNNVNCAEFCERDYYVKVDGSQIAAQTMWRDDCGFNPIYPQGGTWIYNRANWCPGGKATMYEHDLTSYITAGSPADIDVDIESYFWGGTQQPSYIYSIQLVTYEDNNYTNDAAVTDIIQPSLADDHKRLNPSCGQPVFMLKNEGANPLTSVDIEYGVTGGGICTYTWTGNLPFGESEKVILPSMAWTGYDPDDLTFNIEIISVNGTADENPFNNTMSSGFEVPVSTYPPDLKIRIQTNNRGFENGYTLTDTDGNLISERAIGSLGNNTVYEDEVNLTPNCYILRIFDSAGDGLQWWANSAQGTGSAFIFRADVPFALKSFRADFGSEIHYEFTIGELGAIPHSGACTSVANEDLVIAGKQLSVLPNPNNGLFTVQIENVNMTNAQLSILNLLGQTVQQTNLGDIRGAFAQNVDLRQLPRGLYLVNIEYDGGQLSRKILVE